MPTAVKYFHSAQTGAPVLNGVAGSLIGVLDACLKDGFGLKTADSVVVANGIATVSISTGHSFEVDSVALVAGATPAGLNGEKTVLSATTNTFTFDATGIVDQTATGTITVKMAPAGWDKPFSGTNLAVYRSPNVLGTRNWLRVDDTATQNGRVVGYESMTDVNTGVGAFPTAAQISGGAYWPKANGANATARPWLVIADDRTFYLWVNTGTTNTFVSGILFGFGDFRSNKSGDAYATFIAAATTDISATNTANSQTLAYVDAAGDTLLSMWVPRSYTSIGGSAQVSRKAESYNNSDTYSGNTPTIIYPNGPDNGLLLSRTLVMEAAPLCVRGVIPGLMFVPHQFGASVFATRDKISGQGSLSGRKLIAIKNDGNPSGTTITSVTSFIDITGPWG